MGSLRLWLALLISFRHAVQLQIPYSGSIPYASTETGFRVALFMMLSGYFIQLSIDRLAGREQHWLLAFYLKRFLRIFPSYYVVLAATIAFVLIIHPEHSIILSWYRLGELNPFFWLDNLFTLFATSNLVIYVMNLLHMQVAPLKPISSLIVVQSWALSIDTFCYAVSPLLLTLKTRPLCKIFLGLSLLGYAIHPHGFDKLLIVHQLPVFLYGALMYRFAVHTRMPSAAHGFAALGVVLLSSILAIIPNLDRTAFLFLLGIDGLCLPWIAQLTRSWPIDRLLGDMSYPYFLIHIGIFYHDASRRAACAAPAGFLRRIAALRVLLSHAARTPATPMGSSQAQNRNTASST